MVRAFLEGRAEVLKICILLNAGLPLPGMYPTETPISVAGFNSATVHFQVFHHDEKPGATSRGLLIQWNTVQSFRMILLNLYFIDVEACPRC